MYENAKAETTGYGPIAGAGVSSPANKLRDIPRLHQQMDEIEKLLNCCHEQTGRVEMAAERITGPLPQEASKDPGRPPAQSVEQRMTIINGLAESLVHRLNSAASQLDSAV